MWVGALASAELSCGNRSSANPRNVVRSCISLLVRGRGTDETWRGNTRTNDERTMLYVLLCTYRAHILVTCSGRSTQIFYLSKSSNTTVWKYYVASKSPALISYLSKSTKVSESKST